MTDLSLFQEFGAYIQALLNKQTGSSDEKKLFNIISQAKSYNHWFTEQFVIQRVQQISRFLSSNDFSTNYSELLPKRKANPKDIFVSSEENIPLEEFPVLLSILISGNSFHYKTSEKSDKILPFFFYLLGKSIPEVSKKIHFTDKPFRKVKCIFISQKKAISEMQQKYISDKEAMVEIRKFSVAVIAEDEPDENLSLLGDDIFTYFGLGSGNVKKIYIKEGFELKTIFEAIEKWNKILDFHSYANNYQYNQTIYLFNRIPHLDNGFILLKEDKAIKAPIGVLYYEFYDNKTELFRYLRRSPEIEYIYTSHPENRREKFFGETLNQLLLPSENVKKILR